MLISYPILPADAVNQSEQAKFDAMLELTQKDRGLYPVTIGNRWHGGIHLTSGDEPIRAIADGVIVAYRMASATKDYPGQGAYDTSFVLIRHETDSGENTRVVFYSLYMHLKPKSLLSKTQLDQLAECLHNAAVSDDAVQAPADMKVWRKEVLGFGGVLYGQPTVHFEIFATDSDSTDSDSTDGDFKKFWRDRSTIQPGQHGSDDVFGNMHFVIPANRQFSERHPQAVEPHRIKFKNENKFFELEVGQAGQNTQRLHVIVELDKGKRTATTYSLDEQGQLTGQVGTPVVQQDYEYELYRLATALYADCPSAGFEYLRFGRILGPDRTTQIENWQLIRYSETAMGYINLADPATQVSVLSDADFPLYWQALQEGTAARSTDGIANVDALSKRLQLPDQPSAASLFAPPEFAERAKAADAAKALRHFICKHPSEWDASELETRYASLREAGKPLQDKTAWDAFEKHVQAMAFWPQSGIENRSVWHFHPLEFIRHYRKCGWLSAIELARTIPNKPAYSADGQVRAALNANKISMAEATKRTKELIIPLNKTMRKYGLTASRIRQAHFLAQVTLETDHWKTRAEYGKGATNPRIPMTKYYGPFYGRGIMQLTWASNYAEYGSYRNFPPANQNYDDNRITPTSTHYWSNPTRKNEITGLTEVDPRIQRRTWAPRFDPEIIRENANETCDSGGFYWASKIHSGGKSNINREADQIFNENKIGRISVLVNGGGNGYYERQAYARYSFRILTDDTATSQTARHPTGRNGIVIEVDYTSPTEIPNKIRGAIQ